MKASFDSFLEYIITYYSKYISNLSKKTYSLRKLLWKNKEWKWTAEGERIFITLENEVANEQVLTPFNPELLACNAGSKAVGAVLLHIVGNEERPVAFISRSL